VKERRPHDLAHTHASVNLAAGREAAHECLCAAWAQKSAGYVVDLGATGARTGQRRQGSNEAFGGTRTATCGNGNEMR